MPRSGYTLPAGITPMTPYRIKGHSIPKGAEGVNIAYDLLTCPCDSGTIPEPVVLIGPQGEVSVARVPIFF